MARPKLQFGSVWFLAWFGSAEPVKARFGRTLASTFEIEWNDWI